MRGINSTPRIGCTECKKFTQISSYDEDIFITARSPARQQLADAAPASCEPDNSLTNSNNKHAETRYAVAGRVKAPLHLRISVGHPAVQGSRGFYIADRQRGEGYGPFQATDARSPRVGEVQHVQQDVEFWCNLERFVWYPFLTSYTLHKGRSCCCV